MKCTDIYNKAKSDLIDFIKYEIRLICNSQAWPKDVEEFEVEFKGEKPKVEVAVNSSFLDVEAIINEWRDVHKAYLDADNDNVSFLVCREGAEDVIDIDELSVGELVVIGNKLEEMFNKNY